MPVRSGGWGRGCFGGFSTLRGRNNRQAWQGLIKKREGRGEREGGRERGRERERERGGEGKKKQ